ncbi:MAG: sensor domain-containing diguanylate cyclase [Desulfovibrionaceae bacterium CG1_02_65_16]|nr:MAG: sensor domain-containing diguanylate cyclase [Desulfovibrionaceae bacterium CG1_02_65_16]
MNPEPYKTILDNLYDGVYMVDRDRRITYWNRGAERISGYARAEVLDKHCADNLLRHIDEAGMQQCKGLCPLARTLRDGEPREDTVYLHHKQGHRVPISVRISPLRDDAGKIFGAVEIFTDITARDTILCELNTLRHQTLRDQLTGLGNRRAAEEEFGRRCHELKRYNIPFGFFFVDVDHFKDVNDIYGHEAGDRALIMIAKTLNGSLRSVDTVCRWGGEEFLVIVPKVDAAKFKTVGERMRRFVESSTLPLPSGEIGLTVSIGGVMADPTDTFDTLVARADAMMYAAKREGRNRCALDCGQKP